ncbi:aldo/keto reductase [Microbacterium sp. 22215]|uniref:aldo/keto reductase n=1 Tax=Microbacterium sp. 22215 TaxID=3453893 RepID=UPI003F871187
MSTDRPLTLESTILGRTGLAVSPICIGTAAWGVSSPVHGLTVPEEDAVRLTLSAFESPVTFIDTSNNYGDGESERRIGLAVRRAGGVPEGFVIQTKLDRDPESDSFDPDRMRRSLDESLERLGIERVPILHLHDPEHIGFDAAMAPGGPVEVLQSLRDEGYADFIGISGGPARMLTRFVETDVFDVLITHNRATLVDRTADALLDAAAAADMGVVNAAIYGGGILASWPRTSDRYHYAPASTEMLAAIDAMGAACERHGVPLIVAALQSSLRDPRIHSTVCGLVTPQQLDETVRMAETVIPDALWDELDALRPSRESWIDD